MNRERLKQLMPVIQAFMNGAEIQYRNKNEPKESPLSKWSDVTHPYWDDSCDYRIKPKKRVIIQIDIIGQPGRFWARFEEGERDLPVVLTQAYNSCGKDNIKVCRFIEEEQS